jgi:hypothetical protein
VQQQYARLGGDADAYLVVDFQPAAAFERLFIQKYLDMPTQLGPIRRRQAMIIVDILLERVGGGYVGVSCSSVQTCCPSLLLIVHVLKR